MDNRSYDKSKYLTVKEALEASGYHNSYLRMKLLKTGKIAHIRELIPGTQIERILIDRESFESYMTEHETRVARRDDGRNKFVLYATPEELEAIEKLMTAKKIEAPLARANKPKAK